MTLEDKFGQMIQDILRDYPQLFLVLAKIKGNEGNRKVIVLIDGEPTFTIDQCAEISRKIGHQLEETDLIPGKFILEVSSPGLDHPLSLPRQYKKNAGRNVKIELQDGAKLEGKIITATDEDVTVETGKSAQINVLKYTEINKTNIIVSF